MTDYAAAGVDVAKGQAFVNQIKDLVASTHRPGVISGIGGFSGLFELPPGYQQPVLVSGTDGVGTKLKLAFALNQHQTIGIDLVAMCTNDVLVCGAEPLFFLDYIATGKLEPQQLTQVVAGIVAGCQQAGCALLGGETAEMPGFYQASEYDLAGFCVGIVEKSRLIDGSQVSVGDAAIGLASSGVHSNGFSLVRKIVSDHAYNWDDRPEILGGATLGETLLVPTQIYVKPIQAALKAGMNIRAMAHITGGGWLENLPRCLPEGKSLQIIPDSWEVPPVFCWLAEAGPVAEAEMYKTFNMGVGLVVIVPAAEADASLDFYRSHGLKAWVIGHVITGDRRVVLNQPCPD
jgi:phosphoribosylformylglycinamidine cyclo-ligase